MKFYLARLKSVWLIPSLLLLTACGVNATAVTADPTATAVSGNPLEQVFANFLLFLPRVLSGMVLFAVALYLALIVSRLIRHLMQRRHYDPGITLLVYYLSRWGIILFGTASALRQVEFDLTAFLTGLGIIGFTIGFALQGLSQNVTAGILLLIQRPFEIDDSIEVGGYRGKVLSIDLRATELLTADGFSVLIPNASVFTEPIINFSRHPRRRVNLTIGVGYDSDLEQVRHVTLQAIRNLPDVLDDPAPKLTFNLFNSSSIDFMLTFWVDTRIIGPGDALDPAIVAIQRVYAENGIEIPYPIQTQLEIATDPSEKVG